jgi:hypothetical protein
MPPIISGMRDPREDFKEPFPADGLGSDCEPSPLTIGEEQALFAKLFAKHPVFRRQVLGDVLLAAIHRSDEDQDQELKLKCVHPRQPRPGVGLRTTIAPPVSRSESLTFLIGRLFAHDASDATLGATFRAPFVMSASEEPVTVKKRRAHASSSPPRSVDIF